MKVFQLWQNRGVFKTLSNIYGGVTQLQRSLNSVFYVGMILCTINRKRTAIVKKSNKQKPSSSSVLINSIRLAFKSNKIKRVNIKDTRAMFQIQSKLAAKTSHFALVSVLLALSKFLVIQTYFRAMSPFYTP